MVSRKGMLAFFWGVFGPPLITAKCIQADPAENHFLPMVFDVVGRNMLGYWYLEKVC